MVRVAPAETPVPLLSHVRAVELRYFDFSVPDVRVVLVESKNRFCWLVVISKFENRSEYSELRDSLVFLLIVNSQ